MWGGVGRGGEGRGGYPTQRSLPHTPPLPSPLLLYPILLGYVRLRKDEMYGGVVLGKNRFNKDIPLCSIMRFHFNSFSYSYMSSYVDLNQRRF